MPSYAHAAAVLAALSAAPLVSAHDFVSGVVSGGTWYSGTSPNWIYGEKPATASWYAENQDNGFVAPSIYTSGDIICHKSAANGEGSIPVTAGESIDLQWSTWPESHHGPVITYSASCGTAGCESVEKADLKWFKIDARGLNDGATAPGTWATDDLIANKFTSAAKIPSDIAPGSYVHRHEIIALHSAGTEDGAQNYPQCLNVEVSGSGSAAPECVAGTALYTSTDPGILVNIYQSMGRYEIPGPALYDSGSSTGSSHRSSYSSSNSSSHSSSNSSSDSASELKCKGLAQPFRA